MTAGIAFIHGGLHSGSCWERVRALLKVPSIAPDLPGRGTRARPVQGLHVSDFVEAVAQDIDQEGWSDVVVVAHSLGGLTALGLAAARPDRVRHIVFVSCVTPPPGTRPVDALAEPLRSYLSRRLTKAAATPDGTLQIPTWLARRFFCSDLDPTDRQLVLAQCVPDAPTVLLDRTPAAVLFPAITRTWVRLTKDRAIPPRVQDRMRANVDPATVVELSAGHDAMVSQPAALASIVARAGSRYL